LRIADLATGTTAEIEEERRLLYVAMTRAKYHLHLLMPQRFFAHKQRSSGDRHMYVARTRFIPDSILSLFQNRTWSKSGSDSATRPRSSPSVDIAGRIRQMWGRQ
jgi:DNA helicase-2/ATP-dependent DNA helicase PcrA